MKRKIKRILLASLLCFACSSSPGQNNTTDYTGWESLTSSSGNASDETETSGTESSTTGMSDIPNDDTSTGGIKFDVLPEEKENLCKEIDFLFVIDNSGSMADNQENLVNNFQGFIDGIKNAVGFGNFHIGIITTDPYSYNNSKCATYGGLVSQTGGSNSSMSICGPWSKGNFMTTTEIDMINGFKCAAQVGTSGSGDEQPIESFVNSFTPFLNAMGQCNEGFYREDAILIVVFITDEGLSNNNVFTALQEVEFYRGTLENVVALGLVPLATSSCAGAGGSNLRDFIISFPYSYLGDVCSIDYSIQFNEAISVIEDACIPQG